jgi:quercetin dioxygenase-like cupin family protein
MPDPSPAIEVFPAANPPKLTPYGEMIESVFIKGNMGGLVVIKLKAGEIPAHSHEQEHVGVVLEGSFAFFNDDEVFEIKAGEMYRIRPDVSHGIRCQEYALIVQARA